MKLVAHESGSKEKPAILFLHGLGVSSWMWHDQFEGLKDDFYCLGVDLPGNGESFQAEWHSLDKSAAQVAQLIREKTADGKAHVVGLSLGGYTAVSLLTNHPDTVYSMIVSGISTSPLMKKRWARPLSKVIPYLIKFKPLVRLSAKTMQFPEEIVPLYFRDIDRLSKQTIQRIYHEVLNYRLPSLPSSRADDLLVSSGDKEAGAILRGLNFVKKHYGKTAVVQAPDAHHGWNAEHPQLFTDMIRAWVLNQPLPDRLKIINPPQRKILAFD